MNSKLVLSFQNFSFAIQPWMILSQGKLQTRHHLFLYVNYVCRGIYICAIMSANTRCIQFSWKNVRNHFIHFFNFYIQPKTNCVGKPFACCSSKFVFKLLQSLIKTNTRKWQMTTDLKWWTERSTQSSEQFKSRFFIINEGKQKKEHEGTSIKFWEKINAAFSAKFRHQANTIVRSQ